MELPSHRLDPRMLTVWRQSSLALIAGTLVAGVVAALAARHFGWPLAPVVAVAAAIIVIEVADLAVSPHVEYATWRYNVTPTEVDLYHGVFVKKRVIVPLVRVQHVETKQGPFLKASGLAAVRISTAGESFEIPGLAEDDAFALRDRVAELARLAKEDV